MRAAELSVDWREALRGVDGLELLDDALLAPMTSFRIGGPADVLATPRTPEAVLALWSAAQQHDIPLTLLGGGTNILISDTGIRGIVCDLGPGFSYLREHPGDDGRAMWEVGAGCGTSKVVRRGIVRGLRGPEVLAGIPGSMGGALIMNAGGHEGELKEIVTRVQVAHEGQLKWVSNEEAGFSYRSSQFPPGAIILGCELELSPGDPDELQQEVRASQKRRKDTQPLKFGNAGSIFKNPSGHSAGRLIDEAGCKGWTEGYAEVSHKHANFIINKGGATAADVWALIKRVRRHVFEHAGVRLELEVRPMGEFPELEEL